MKMSHRGGERARSQGRCYRRSMRAARGKASGGSEFPRGARQSAAEVILGVAVAAWKTWAAGAHDRSDLRGGDALAEQLLGDPLIHNAPVGLWEASGNSQPVQPIRVDCSGSCWTRTGISANRSQQRRRDWWRRDRYPSRRCGFWFVKPAKRPRCRQSLLAKSAP